MQGDYLEQAKLIFDKMIETIKKETAAGRHPHVRIEWTAPAGDITSVRIESEQISERLEMRPPEFVIFKDLLKANSIELEG